MKNTTNNCNTVSEESRSTKADYAESASPGIASNGQKYSDAELQRYLLDGVSRTFALTIPELPGPLQQVVGNAYLLCRIVDTIEDSMLTSAEKELFSQQFVHVLKGDDDGLEFARKLAGKLGTNTRQAERELISLTSRVVSITHNFTLGQQKAILRCVDIMAKGMIYYQQNASADGLKTIEETNKYCYCVAGVVGEMLTELFCIYSPEINRHHDRLMDLSVRFGLALQMTNILKDMWDDLERSVCWLPRSVFENYNFDLRDLPEGHSTDPFQKGLEFLIGRTNDHLHKAMEYTLLIPPGEKEIRRFCSWSLGMSVLTLRKLNNNKGFTDGEQVKISHNSVKATILAVNLSVERDWMLNSFFKIASAGLPLYPA